MIDDVPFGAQSLIVVPDLDPGDLARIEVLRGPQGTLYGASSMGGLVKFVTLDPSTEGVNGRLQAGTNSVRNGAELGYTARGSVNVPLTSDLAIRASAFTREDPGYIDNPVLGIDGINKVRASGAHISALWRLSNDFSLRLSALYQRIKSDGGSDITVLPGLANLQQSYARGVGGYNKQAQAYSATLKGRIGSIDLVSLTGYNVNSPTDSFDWTAVLGPLVQGDFPLSTAAPISDHGRTSKITQEIRLSSPIGRKVDGLLGAYYTHEYSPYSQTVLAQDAISGAVAGQWIDIPFSTKYTEYAAFADLTYHVTEQFDIEIGARESHIAQTGNTSATGPGTIWIYGVPSPYRPPQVHSTSNPFTYLLTPQFKVSPDLMLYARLASGYRSGGSNAGGGPGIPPEFGPDKTKDYEIGAKGNLLGHTASFDLSIYYIDWQGIQLGLVNPATNLAFTGNAGRAKSQGVELSIETRPVTGLKVAAWVAVADAELTTFPPEALLAGTYAFPGDRLPYSSRFSGSLSVDEEFPLWGQTTGFVGASASYVGDRKDVFTGPPPAQRQKLPAYAKTDLRAGVKYESWTVNLYANNITDRRGLITGGAGNPIPYSFYYIQPRTVGLSLSRVF